MSKLLTLALSFLFTSSVFSEVITLDVSNTILIRGRIDQQSIDLALQDLVRVNKNRTDTKTPIYIVLDSPGGSVLAGNKFINFANTIENVHTICLSCASMAHAIVQGVEGTRYATPDNLMMAHRARGTFRGQFEDGEVESKLKVVKSLVRFMEKRNARRIGVSLNTYKKKALNEWWTFGEQSVDENFADEITKIKCTQDLIDEKRSVKVFTLFGIQEGPAKSQCPLL